MARGLSSSYNDRWQMLSRVIALINVKGILAVSAEETNVK